jgi:predicted Zn-dependent protease
MTAKTIKHLAILIVVFGAVGGGGYLLWQFQVGRMARDVVVRAAQAGEKKDFATAEQLYREYLAVLPDDLNVMFSYADVILAAEKTSKRQSEALDIYTEILRQMPGREDARQKAAELAVELGGNYYQAARRHLSILLRSQKDDGHLEFLMGQCYEHEKENAKAAASYQAAIEHKAPERLEACQHLATLLRERLGQPDQADQVIEAMVQSDPRNARVYLERGRYRRRFGLRGADVDFQKALQQTPLDPEIYLEMARAAESDSGISAARGVLNDGLALHLFNAARRILDDHPALQLLSGAIGGLRLEAALAIPEDERQTTPYWIEVYRALTQLEIRDHHVDQAIEVLERGLRALPGQAILHWQLANLLAANGDTGKLLLQIEELRRIGFSQVLIGYLRACYHVNNKEFYKARDILTSLQGSVAGSPELKARVNVLLAQVYGQLSEPGLQQDAYQRAASANPEDISAQLGLIAGMISRGENTQAIEAYRRLLDQAPDSVRIPLARLLIARNRERPEPEGDFREAERLINDAIRAAPESAEPLVLKSRLLADRGRDQEARDLLAASRSRLPTRVELWTAEAELLARRQQFDPALGLLDQAQRQLGDRVELRLCRASVWVTRGGPQVIAILNDLAGNIERFSRENRRTLLTTLAVELNRRQDLPGATRLWTQLAEQEPDDLEPRLQLLELALQAGDQKAIETDVQAVEKIDALFGRYCRARYLIWQAQHATDVTTRQLRRSAARTLLNELKSRRQDWSLIPLALAQLEEQELEQDGLDEARTREKQETLTNLYIQAIHLGQHNAAVVRRAAQLLVATGRAGEVLHLYNLIPLATQLAATDLGRLAARLAVSKRDYQQAEEIARKAVAVRPGDFQERLWLVRILLEGGRQADAEAEVRQAISSSRADPSAWLALVQVLILTNQFEKAEQAVRDAEAVLVRAPLELAQCCEMMGRAFERGDADKQATMKKWFAEARGWYAKAQAAPPGGETDVAIARRLTDFFLRTNQVAEAEKQLSGILGSGSGAKTKTTVAWARRSLAQIYSTAADHQKVRQALALFEPAGPQGSAIEDPEDLRVLARVLEAQRDPEHRKRAIHILESLIGRNLANSEDRFFLARLVELAGDWPKAREQYRELNLLTDNPRDIESINRRPIYLIQFAESLIRNRRPGEEQDLAEAQDLIVKLKKIQPDLLPILILEVELNRARNQRDEATALIQSQLDRPKLTLLAERTLARLAEELGQFDLSEKFYRRLVADTGTGPGAIVAEGQLLLAQFLGRRGRTREGLDICESLWSDPSRREAASIAAVQVLLWPAGNSDPDPAQRDRVVRWLEQGLEQNPQSIVLLVSLANLNEALQDYQKAENLYRRAIQQNDREGVACNNLAWLMALRRVKLSEALDLINNAIKMKGPKPDFLDTRGIVYLSFGEDQRAIADLETAVAADPTGPKYFHLAQAYLKVNDRDKAKKSLEAAKTRGLPAGLHRLEQPAYQKVISELKTSSTGPPPSASGSNQDESIASRITPSR